MYETEIDYSTYSQNVTGYDGEGQLTSAIAYCTSNDMPKVYMITGHNEYTLDSGFTTALEKENIDYETISLMEYDAIRRMQSVSSFMPRRRISQKMMPIR